MSSSISSISSKGNFIAVFRELDQKIIGEKKIYFNLALFHSFELVQSKLMSFSSCRFKRTFDTLSLLTNFLTICGSNTQASV